jgi:hypothetical protein
MIYSWKVPVYSVDAQIAGETIEDIKNKSGKDFIEPEDLLENSRDKNAPLHSCFEWDDGKAAEKYRLSQARSIIQNITVTITGNSEKTPQTVRAFVNVSAGNEKGKFVNINTAMTNEKYNKQVLANALSELVVFKAKYSGLCELEKLFSEIDALKKNYP